MFETTGAARHFFSLKLDNTVMNDLPMAALLGGPYLARSGESGDGNGLNAS